jgi:hypothetical protein
MEKRGKGLGLDLKEMSLYGPVKRWMASFIPLSKMEKERTLITKEIMM